MKKFNNIEKEKLKYTIKELIIEETNFIIPNYYKQVKTEREKKILKAYENMKKEGFIK